MSSMLNRLRVVELLFNAYPAPDTNLPRMVECISVYQKLEHCRLSGWLCGNTLSTSYETIFKTYQTQTKSKLYKSRNRIGLICLNLTCMHEKIDNGNEQNHQEIICLKRIGCTRKIEIVDLSTLSNFPDSCFPSVGILASGLFQAFVVEDLGHP